MTPGQRQANFRLKFRDAIRVIESEFRPKPIRRSSWMDTFKAPVYRLERIHLHR